MEAVVISSKPQTSHRECAGCGKVIEPGVAHCYHVRLGVFVHETCTWLPVRGEDISSHCMMYGLK